MGLILQRSRCCLLACNSYALAIHFDSGRAASLDGNCAAPYDVIIASELVYSAMDARFIARSVACFNGERCSPFRLAPPPFAMSLCCTTPTAIRASHARTNRLAVFFRRRRPVAARKLRQRPRRVLRRPHVAFRTVSAATTSCTAFAHNVNRAVALTPSSF